MEKNKFHILVLKKMSGCRCHVSRLSHYLDNHLCNTLEAEVPWKCDGHQGITGLEMWLF